MKRTVKILLGLLAVALLGFSSCKKDPKNNPNEKKGDAYISFTFNLPQGNGFRADANDVAGANAKDTYKGTNEEQAIKEVRVALYDEAGKCQYALDYAITANGGAAPTGEGLATGASNTAAKFTTKAEGVTSQKYWMLAIINPTAEVKAATAVGKFKTDVKKAIETTATVLTQNGVMMTNEQGLVEIGVDKLKQEPSQAEAAPVAVSVDRAVAKVFVGGTPTFENGKLEDIKWQLNTTNKKTYIYRKLAMAWGGTKDNFVQEANNTPRFNRYAEDPNFFDYQFDATHADFNYIDGTPTLTNTFGFEDANGEYCLENTMDALQQKHNRTTSFVLSGVWVPQAHNGITFVKGQSWYSYMGFTFTTEKMREYIVKANDSSDPNPEIPGTPTGFKKALYEMITPTVPAPGGPTTAPAYIVDNATGEPSASGTVNEIKAYKKGVCYYQTNLIRHFINDESSIDMGYGRYGVVRNNIYKISISKISQPGEPTITPEKDDDGDDDPTKVFVSFDITVNPWIVRTQEISL